ncbi:MAG: VOC family protein [Desulfobacteraceae bacterium]|nr:VOC family protein [Desulfobacteraceae bacterium]
MITKFNEKFLRANSILYCEKFNRTIRFYRDILNFPVVHETEWFVEFKLGDKSFLSIADARRTTIDSGNGAGITLSFKVRDLDRAHEMLNDLGIETSDIRPVWGARAFFMSDPEGHRIELWC